MKANMILILLPVMMIIKFTPKVNSETVTNDSIRQRRAVFDIIPFYSRRENLKFGGQRRYSWRKIFNPITGQLNNDAYSEQGQFLCRKLKRKKNSKRKNEMKRKMKEAVRGNMLMKTKSLKVLNSYDS